MLKTNNEKTHSRNAIPKRLLEASKVRMVHPVKSAT
jgi:hypothetical protein